MFVLNETGSNALIVGQAPAKNDDPLRPLCGKSGRRIAEMMGDFPNLIPTHHDIMMATFDRANLLDYWPGSASGKGDKFPMDEARREAAALWDHCLGFTTCRYDWLLLLGRNVQRAFRQSDPWMEWRLMMPQALQIAALPHPSGVNHWWNDETNTALAAEFLSDWRKTVERQRTTTDV